MIKRSVISTTVLIIGCQMVIIFLMLCLIAKQREQSGPTVEIMTAKHPVPTAINPVLKSVDIMGGYRTPKKAWVVWIDEEQQIHTFTLPKGVKLEPLQ
jgi:hypothetical protein